MLGDFSDIDLDCGALNGLPDLADDSGVDPHTPATKAEAEHESQQDEKFTTPRQSSDDASEPAKRKSPESPKSLRSPKSPSSPTSRHKQQSSVNTISEILKENVYELFQDITHYPLHLCFYGN